MEGPRPNQLGSSGFLDEPDSLLFRPSNAGRSEQTDQTTETSRSKNDDYDEWLNWVYPPEFYDRLSKIHLTEGALEELNRRNKLVQCQENSQQKSDASLLVGTMPKDPNIARFARHGGPDLGDVRNYPPSTTRKVHKSTPYAADFGQHLEDHDVHAIDETQKPTNLAEIGAALNHRRASLSSSQFSENAFDTFKRNNRRATNEDAMMVDVMPTILGGDAPYGNGQALERNTLFRGLAPLTDGTITAPKPDIYYGAPPKELHHSIRDAIGHHVVPSTVRDKPVAPNFFVEVKGPDGRVAVVRRQILYDGAIGARAMSSLQSYGQEHPQYDGQAHSFSSSYYDGSIKLYAHHATAPTSQGGQPEYHTTQISACDVTSNRNAFVQGVSAFRNARDLAQQHRDRFIQAANEMGNKTPPRPSSGVLEDINEVDEETKENQNTKNAGPKKRRLRHLSMTTRRLWTQNVLCRP